MSIRKGRRWLLAGLLLAAAVVVGLVVVAKGGEPRYEGSSESYWLKEYCRVQAPHGHWLGGQPEQLAAFQAMGDDAVPYVVEEAFSQRQDSALLTNMYRLSQVLHQVLPLPKFVSAAQLREGASFLLQELKPPARVLLPLLAPHLKSTNQAEHQAALYLLGTAGDGAEQAVPGLIAGLKETNALSRRLAVQSLGWLGPKSGAAVPASVELMTAEQAANYWDYALAITLGKIGSNAAPAVPLVKEMFERMTNWNPGCNVAAALLRMDGSQTGALDYLVTGLTNHQPASDRWMAAMALGAVGPGAKSAVPALLAVMVGSNANLTAQATHALQALGVPKDRIITLLKQNLGSTDETTSVNSAARILNLDPTDHGAHLVLMGLIQKRSIFSAFAIEALGKAGPAAAEAIPVLRTEAAGTAQKESSAAKEALRRIEAKPKGPAEGSRP